MKKFLTAIVAILLSCTLLFAFVGCTDADAKLSKSTDKTTIKLDTEIEKEIIASFVAKHSGDKYPVAEDEVSLRCYGAFDGVYVLFVDVIGWDYTMAIERDVIADVEFIYGSGQKMTAYSTGEFCSLSNAYANNILARDNLLTVQKNYSGRA